MINFRDLFWTADSRSSCGDCNKFDQRSYSLCRYLQAFSACHTEEDVLEFSIGLSSTTEVAFDENSVRYWRLWLEIQWSVFAIYFGRRTVGLGMGHIVRLKDKAFHFAGAFGQFQQLKLQDMFTNFRLKLLSLRQKTLMQTRAGIGSCDWSPND